MYVRTYCMCVCEHACVCTCMFSYCNVRSILCLSPCISLTQPSLIIPLLSLSPPPPPLTVV